MRNNFLDPRPPLQVDTDPLNIKKKDKSNFTVFLNEGANNGSNNSRK